MLKHVGIEPADNIVQLFLQLPYDRQQEHEADLIAMVLLSKVRSDCVATLRKCLAARRMMTPMLQSCKLRQEAASLVRMYAHCHNLRSRQSSVAVIYIRRAMVLMVPGGLQACYNFAAGIELFARLQKDAKDCDTDAWLQHWSSHPSMQDRVAKLKAHFPAILKDSPCVYKQELLEAMAHIASTSV